MAKKMFPMKGNYKVSQYKYSFNGAPFADQHVDIVIPYHGQYEILSKLVRSLIYGTRSNLFRVCLVDDCSPNQHYLHDAFDPIPNLKQIRNSERLGYGASLEEGLKALNEEPGGLFPWLVFMHSDCYIEDPNWLIAMGQTMQKLKKNGVKMIGSLTNNPKIDDPKFKSDKNNLEDNQDIILEDGEYLPLHCVMCHRNLFSHIGGFIKHYPYIGYEDQELAMRMRASGYKQAICGKSWVGHLGGATRDYVSKDVHVAAEIRKNKERFLLDTAKYRKSKADH